jgi:hypothetical protein
MDTKKLAYIGAGAVLLWFILKPKTAKAETAAPTGAGAGPGSPNFVGPPAPDDIMPLIPPVTDTTPPAQGTQDGSTATQTQLKDPATGQILTGPSAPIQAGTRYTVRSGESWSNIASRTYGDYRWWPFLWDTNRSPTKYVDASALAVGDAIELPASTPTDPAYKSAIFARAKAYSEWYVANQKTIKNGGRPRPPPAMALTQTPMPSVA